MINTLIFYNQNNFPIPQSKLFEKIFNLEESLEGQSVSIKSIFNSDDNTPSMKIFFSDKDNEYRFKDFSSGNFGDAIEVIMYLNGLSSRTEGYQKAMEMFKGAAFEYQLPEYVETKKELIDYTVREWYKYDEEFWYKFGISGKLLLEHNIKPISEQVMRITKGEKIETLTFNTNICYGYFNKENILYKIYNPKSKKNKFITLKDDVQGHDQLKYEGQCLIIGSSMKDILSFKSLQFKGIELIAPQSENTKLTIEQINFYKSKYKYIFTMFDNDVAGMKAMHDYQELYQIPYLYFNIEKDIADCVKEHGRKNTRLFLTQIIKDGIDKQNNKATQEPF